MRRVTSLLMMAAFLFTGSAFAQSTDYSFQVDVTEDPQRPYGKDHSGARGIAGPFDLDNDGKAEVLVSDYTGGGRVHVLEVVGPDQWELVYSTPWLDDTPNTGNARAVAGGDMDGDGKGEIYLFAGSGYAEGSPYPFGLYVFEWTGIDNDYGTEPGAIYQGLPNTTRWRQEEIVVKDVDRDGVQEMMFGNNDLNPGDNWWIISVSGDIGSGFETWVVEAEYTSRALGNDLVDRGGGSPYSIVDADLDGNGIRELVMHSWNYLNIAIGQVTAPDLYYYPDGAQGPVFAQMTRPSDEVSLFGLEVYDINGDGDEEVFGISFQTAGLFVVNYEDGENVLQISPENYAVNVVPGFSDVGLAIGDLDQDGNPDIIGTGTEYRPSAFDRGDAPNWVSITEFVGTDPEDPASYSEIVEVYFPNDLVDDFDLVKRDSAGVMTEYREEGQQGNQFASKFVWLGDADDDGFNEVALTIQGIDDSLYTYQEVFNPADSTYSRTLLSVEPGPARVFMRVLSAAGQSVAIEDERVIIPSDYVLEQNYPNPFNPTTSIRFELPRDKAVSLTIFDVSGRVVKTLVDNQHLQQGVHEIQWDGTNQAGAQVASGTYLYQLKFGNFAHTKTMVLLK